MKKAELLNNNTKKHQLVGRIDKIINSILHICFLVLFVTIFERILGDSQVALIASIIIGLFLSAVIMTIIERSVIGFGSLLLITAPAFALAFIFLLM